jgi:alpha-ribazole phosphatase
LRDTHEDKIIKVHIIRHGKTEANERRLYCGVTDLPLSEAGAADLVRLRGEGIYPEKPCLYYTSGLQRTEETLDIIFGPVGRNTIPALAEFNFGAFEMKSYEMIKEQDDYQAWITDETGKVPCPGGDNKNAFTRRVIAGYEYLIGYESLMGYGSPIKNANSDIFLVCHGGVIVTVMEYLFPNTRNFYEWQPKPGRGYSITYESDNSHKYKPI